MTAGGRDAAVRNVHRRGTTPLHDITTLLGRWRNGDGEAVEALFPLVYGELRARARRYISGERDAHTLSSTDLVHETYLELVDIRLVDWQDRCHFYAVAARAMRRILVSYARRHAAAKRGGRPVRVPLDGLPLAEQRSEDLLALDRALRKLAQLDERLSRIVELRFFGGLTLEETAEALGVGPTTVKLDWRKARAWLYRELQAPATTP